MQHTALCKVRGVLHCGQVVGKQKCCSVWLLQLCSIAAVIANNLVLNSLSSAEPPNPFVLLPVQPSGSAPHGGGEPQGTPVQAQGVQ